MKYANSILLLFLLTVVACGPEHSDKLNLSVAASLAPAINEISTEYTKTSGNEVRLDIASSGSLARKIASGAQTDIFFSASRDWIDYLLKENLTREKDVEIIAHNSLVLITNVENQFESSGLDYLSEAKTIALGDPVHVPAGKYASQALEYLGLYEKLTEDGKIVLCPSVRNVLALVERGEAGAGIVYYSDAAISNDVKQLYVFPDSSHDSIDLYSAVISNSTKNKKATEFLGFLKSDRGKDIFRRHAFIVEDNR